jgi:hypothetical protein
VKPLAWFSDDTRVLVTLALELLLAVAILRFVLRRRKTRLLAGAVFVILVAAQAIAYDFFVALPASELVSHGVVRQQREILVLGADVRTRFLGYPLLRLVVFVNDPQGALVREPQMQLFDRGTRAVVVTQEFSGVDRVFVVTVRSGGNRVNELSPGRYGQLDEEKALAEIAALDSATTR